MWTKEELDFLKTNINVVSTKQIANSLHKSPKAIRLKCMRSNLPIIRQIKEKLKCLQCKIEIHYNKKFCSHSCAATYNNTTRKKKYNRICEECKTPFSGYRETSKYCTRKCMGIAKSRNAYLSYINNQDNYCNENYAPKQFKHIFLQEQNGVCAIEGCGSKVVWNNKPLVFVLDHIDGNAENNKRINLRLVCPNCDSQLPTFKSRNKGKGRFFRQQRRLEGKSF